MIYILRKMYKPNRAETNRLLSILRRFDERNIKVSVVFFQADDKLSECEVNFKNVTFCYYWKKFRSRIEVINKFLVAFYVFQFRNSLKAGDTVLLDAMENYVKWFVTRDDITVYHQITEYPGLALEEPSFKKLRAAEYRKYLKAVPKLDGIFVISTALKQFFVEHGVPEHRIVIINMTVDSNRFEGLQKQQTERYIAYCGDVSSFKDGVDTLIKAFKKVVDQYEDSVKLYIIGPKSSKDDAELFYKLIEDLDLDGKVVMTGLIPASEMPQLLKNAEVLALARPDNIQAHYGFATKIGEYLLTKNPVVVTTVGDFPLFLEDKVSALLSEPDNADAFADKLLWALNHKDEAKKIGEAGAEVALRNFNYQIETDKIITAVVK